MRTLLTDITGKETRVSETRLIDVARLTSRRVETISAPKAEAVCIKGARRAGGVEKSATLSI